MVLLNALERLAIYAVSGVTPLHHRNATSSTSSQSRRLARTTERVVAEGAYHVPLRHPNTLLCDLKTSNNTTLRLEEKRLTILDGQFLGCWRSRRSLPGEGVGGNTLRAVAGSSTSSTPVMPCDDEEGRVFQEVDHDTQGSSRGRASECLHREGRQEAHVLATCDTGPVYTWVDCV